MGPVKIFGTSYEVKASVSKANAYSAHADQTELLDWVGRVRETGDPRHVFLVHGEEEAALGLAELLREKAFQNVEVPERGQSFEV